jgi:hypothetical protein
MRGAVPGMCVGAAGRRGLMVRVRIGRGRCWLGRRLRMMLMRLRGRRFGRGLRMILMRLRGRRFGSWVVLSMVVLRERGCRHGGKRKRARGGEMMSLH